MARDKSVLKLLAKNLSYTINVKCPKCTAIGEIVKSRARKGKVFKGIKCWLCPYKYNFSERDIEDVKETLALIDDTFKILMMKLTER